MTYTQNHRLPQWEQTDPVRMSDFNDAMRAIDTGLAATGDKTFDSLCRLARNQYNLLRDAGNLSKWTGAFRQGFAKTDNANIAGAYQKADRVWIADSDATPTQASLQNLTQVQAFTATVYTAVFTFTTTCPGRLTSLFMNGQFTVNVADPDNTVNVRLINQSAGGTTEATCTSSLGLNASSGSSNYKITFQLDIPFHAGQNYRLEMERADKRSAFFVAMSASAGTNFMTFEKVSFQPSVRITRTFREEAAAQGALVLAHYRATNAQGGTVSLEYGGKPVSLYTTRSVTSQGQAMTEAEFRLDQAIPASCDMTLCASCASGGELELFDWGGMFI